MIKFSILHRILHWVTAISMFVLFITGALRVLFLGRRALTDTMMNGLAEKGYIIERSEFRSITNTIIEPWFQYHIYFAYVALLIYIARLVYMAVKGVRFPNPFSNKLSAKQRFQGSIYIVFYLLVFVQIFTGFYMLWGGQYMVKELEAIHKWATYWMPLFVCLHFGGIILAENGKDKGVASKMIGGE